MYISQCALLLCHANHKHMWRPYTNYCAIQYVHWCKLKCILTALIWWWQLNLTLLYRFPVPWSSRQEGTDKEAASADRGFHSVCCLQPASAELSGVCWLPHAWRAGIWGLTYRWIWSGKTARDAYCSIVGCDNWILLCYGTPLFQTPLGQLKVSWFKEVFSF